MVKSNNKFIQLLEMTESYRGPLQIAVKLDKTNENYNYCATHNAPTLKKVKVK